MKFRPTINGTITGIRFYKAAANTGTHIGSLWTTAARSSRRRRSRTRPPPGWQTVTFATPVAVTAGTTYVASYFTPSGHYSVDGARHDAARSTTARCTRSRNSREPERRVRATARTSTFPTQLLQRDQLLGRRACTRCRMPGQATGVAAAAGRLDVRARDLDRARDAAARRPRTGSRRTSASTAQTPKTVPAADDERDGDRPDDRHDLHVHGRGASTPTAPGPISAASNARHADRRAVAPVRADERRRAPGDQLGARELDGARRATATARSRARRSRRTSARRADAGQVGAARDQRDGQRPDERRRATRSGSARPTRSARAPVEPLERGHAAVDAVRLRDARDRRLRRHAARSSSA